MAFDPKSIVKNPAFAIGGGVCIGMAVYSFISLTIGSLIQPWFHAILRRGGVWNITDDVALGCGPWIAGGMIFIAAVLAGIVMIKIASRD